MSDGTVPDPDDGLLVRYVDGEPTQIRTNLRLTGSDAAFAVNGDTAELVGLRCGSLDELVAEVEALPFIETVKIPEDQQ